MIVMKFGGTSVRDPAAMDRAAAIVAGRIDRAPLVVVSAMSGVTGSLLEAARLARSGSREDALRIYGELRDRHMALLPPMESEPGPDRELSLVTELDELGQTLDEFGLKESGLAKLITKGFDLLGLQTFFTAGEKEVRAWVIHKGDTAPIGAGVKKYANR